MKLAMPVTAKVIENDKYGIYMGELVSKAGKRVASTGSYQARSDAQIALLALAKLLGCEIVQP